MAHFTIRVELHSGTKQDYLILHRSLIELKFVGYIVGEDGTKWLLPSAEYNLIGDYTKQEVLQLVTIAAKKTAKNYWILVTKSAGRIWSLSPLNPQR